MKKIIRNVVWLLMLPAVSAPAQANPAEGSAPFVKKSETALMGTDLLSGRGVVIDRSRMKNFHFSSGDITDPAEYARFCKKKRTRHTVRRSQGEEKPLYTVKCVFKEAQYLSFLIYNSGLFEEAGDDGWDDNYTTYSFKVPAGTYDVASHYWSSKEGMEGWGYLVHEEINVDKDVVVEFSANELTEKIVLRPMLRDGREALLPISRGNGVIDDSNATVQFSLLDYECFREGCDVVFAGNEWGDVVEPGFNDETALLCNKLSDKYHLVFYYCLQDDKGVYHLSTTEKAGLSSGIVENYNRDYVRYDVPGFSKTPLSDEIGTRDFHTAVSGAIWYNDVAVGGGGCYSEEATPEVWWTCQPMPDIDIKSPVSVINVQAEETFIYEEDGHEYMEIDRAEIYSLPALFNGTEWEYINQNHSKCGNYTYQFPSGGGPAKEYPGVPAYCYSADGISQPLGNSAPLLSLMTQFNAWDGTQLFLFNPNAYIGRYGEVRGCDLWKQRIEVSLDGKKVFDNAEGGYLEDWCVTNSTDGHQKGVVEATFTNNNVLVDGTIPGFNRTTITFDERKEDFVTPTPQMLIFKHTSGTVTDRFDKAGDGVIEFSAGDFSQSYGAGGSFTATCGEADVLVEYAPYGEETFAPIEVEEIPENFYMPGFGYFYRGSLKDIQQKSANGWFDLRLTLTDKAGNKMVQTISPAFRINANAGVDTTAANGLRIISDGGRLTVCGGEIAGIELYGIDGRLVGASSCNTLDASGYRGLAIAKITETTGTTTTAKIIVR